jgi:hypothetical protein
VSTIGSAERRHVADGPNGRGSAQRFSPPIRSQAVNQAVDRVHVVFKTHLDIGFSDFASTIVARYMDEFIPKAISLSEQMRAAGPGRAGRQTDQLSTGFIWTTGSWLIHEYLERADGAGRRRMEAAIEAGDVAWHALPFSLFSENMDASLFRFGLSLSQRLDARFGKRTIAAKMTDVPGHTRGIVPLLAEAGVEFLHIGVNAASTPPDVPPVFVWRDPASGAEIVVMYQGNYGDVMVVPGLADALAFAHTDDNVGPQSADQLEDVYRTLAARFPDARIQASTMDAFAERLRLDSRQPAGHHRGDRRYLDLRRRQRSTEAGAVPGPPPSPPGVARIGRIGDGARGLQQQPPAGPGAHERPRRQDAPERLDPLQPGRLPGRARAAELPTDGGFLAGAARLSWGGSVRPTRARRSEAADVLAQLTPARPDATAYERIADLSQPLQTEHFSVAFDQRVGSLIRLQSGDTDWAGPPARWGRSGTRPTRLRTMHAFAGST